VFRSKYLAVFIFYAVYAFSGCAPDKVGLELVDYVNQGMLSISQLEIKALERYGAVTGANYTTDEAVYETLKNEVIPLYGRFVELLKQIPRQSDEVRQLHTLYLNGAEMMYAGFKSKQQALEKKDAALMQGANAQIEKGRVETEKWHEQLLSLSEAHGVRSAPESKDSAFKRRLIEPPTE